MTSLHQLDGHVMEEVGPRSPSAGRLIRELKESLTKEYAGSMPISPKNSKALRKAEILGWETRNVSNHWLAPLSLNTRSTQGSKVEQPGAMQQQLHPTYGPGQSTPQELGAIRATRMIQNLGRTAIYSDSPYMNNALESLVHAYCGDVLQPRRTGGHLPHLGSKAAAIDRAKRALSEFTPFRPEVPFADAVRVATLHDDRTALPALIETYILNRPRQSGAILEQHCHVLAVQAPAMQLQAAALLVQRGFYFAAIKVVHTDPELLSATLEEISLILSQDLGGEQGQAAAWNWKESDKELFCQQFIRLRIIGYYRELREQLQLLRGKGSAALAHVEREMLFKVVQDFRAQLAAGSHAAQLPAGVQEEDSSPCVSPAGRNSKSQRDKKSVEPRYMPSPPSNKGSEVSSPTRTKATGKALPTAKPSAAALSASTGAQQRASPVPSGAASTTKAATKPAARPAKGPAGTKVESMQASAEPSLATYLQPQAEPSLAPVTVPPEPAAPVVTEPSTVILQPEAGDVVPILAAAKAAAELGSFHSSPTAPAAQEPEQQLDDQPGEQHPAPAAVQPDAGHDATPRSSETLPAALVPMLTQDAVAQQSPEQSTTITAAVTDTEAAAEMVDQPHGVVEEGSSGRSSAQPAAPHVPPAAEVEDSVLAQAQCTHPPATDKGQCPTQEAGHQCEDTATAQEQCAHPSVTNDGPCQAQEAGDQCEDPVTTVTVDQAVAVEAAEPDAGANNVVVSEHTPQVADDVHTVSVAEQAAPVAADSTAALQFEVPEDTNFNSEATQPDHSLEDTDDHAVDVSRLSNQASASAAQQVASDVVPSEPETPASAVAIETVPEGETQGDAQAGETTQNANAPAIAADPAPASVTNNAVDESQPQERQTATEEAAQTELQPAAAISCQQPVLVASKPPSRTSSTRAASNSRPPSHQNSVKAVSTSQPSSQPGSRQASRQASQRTTPRPAAVHQEGDAKPLAVVDEAPTDEAARVAMEASLADLRRAGSAAREAAAAAAAAAAGSPRGPRHSSVRGSGSIRGSAAIPLTQDDQQVKVTAMFGEDQGAQDFDAQRAHLAAELMEEEQKALEQRLAQKQSDVAILEAAREQLTSARSARTPTSGSGRPLTPQEQQVSAALDEHINSVESRLQKEREALALLQEEKRKHEEEKRTLNEQLAKTMRLFQDQLSQTIKMAAMLQAQRIMTGGPPAETPKMPEVPLPQEVDEPPTPEEIQEYGRYLGMDVEVDSDLLYIAEWALTAPVPEGWTVHLDQEGHEFFYNAATSKSCYEHPMDQHYKEYYTMKKLEKQQKAVNGAKLKPVRV